jgi:hypothetical protein
MRGFSMCGGKMDRQSEAYRRMTDEDVAEDFPGSIHHPPVTSLSSIHLPQDYPDLGGKSKTLIMAEVALHERIMDPTAPDDHKVQGVYVRMSHRHGEDSP